MLNYASARGGDLLAVRGFSFLILTAALSSVVSLAFAESFSSESNILQVDGQNYFAPEQSFSKQPSFRSNNLWLSAEPIGPQPTSQLSIGSYPLPKNLRVLIYPHWGLYSLPQGKEATADQFEIQSEKECVVRPKANSGVPQRPVLLKSKSLKFSTASVLEILIVTCPSAAKLVRDEGLEAFSYEGQFEVHPLQMRNGQRILQVVLILPFESYLKGVLPAEMPSHWHMEALKAQAIAARSYAIHELKNPNSFHEPMELETAAPSPGIYDMDDTVLYQAFVGVSRKNPRTDEAVTKTQGQVALYRGQPIKAFFSADSGGYTESSKNLWDVDFPYCLSKPEKYDLKFGPGQWQASFTLAGIENILRSKNAYALKSSLKKIEFTGINESRRVMTVNLKGAGDEVTSLSGADFQRFLRMKSNKMELQANPSGEVIISGWGFGHGVGMSQWGAYILADKYQWKYDQIVKFYYSDLTSP